MDSLGNSHAREAQPLCNQVPKGFSIAVPVSGVEKMIQSEELRHRAAQREAAQYRHGGMAGHASVIVVEELIDDGVVMLARAENRGDASDEYIGHGFRIPIQQ